MFKSAVRALSVGEGVLRQKLEQACGGASLVRVQDTSGGCGAFFSILVVSPRFEGLRLMEQHKWVKKVLEEEIPQIHGLTITTRTPAEHDSDSSDQ